MVVLCISLLIVISVSNFQPCLGRHLERYSTSSFRDLSKYAIIFDAGSSKTKMEIYKIDVASPPLDVSDVHKLKPIPSKVKPGIGKLAAHPWKVEGYLKPLLDSAMKAIPVEKHSTTPIFFLATAGMRLLSEDQSSSIINQVKILFNDKLKCPFMFDPIDVRVISGAFEGIYAWISVNFLEGNFIPKRAGSTYGILDLGGASHQNTFNTSDEKRKDLYVLNVGGKQYDLFARSYLGFGLNEARNRYLLRLSQGPLPNNELLSPCHHKGYRVGTTINGKKFIVVGTASVSNCRLLIDKTFFCKDRACPFHDQPKLHGRFFGFSGIYYSAITIGILDPKTSKPLTPAMFDKGSRNFCSKDFESIKVNPYAKTYCFGSNFVYELLTKGYGLPANKAIMVGNKLKGFDLGWTLGAVLYNSGML
ncbi:ectonucleoside triphosphate diphosphohydrolase 1-like [Stylophora pistillata]|nr:ectonucleoside triphosphate diphosphohydrolase 1-like [Stylophora pistillata]